jgi:hypothetical protein
VWSVSTIGFVTVLTVWSVSTIGVVTVLTCGLCFYDWVCNCSYGVVSVSTIGVVTVLTVWSMFLQLGL